MHFELLPAYIETYTVNDKSCVEFYHLLVVTIETNRVLSQYGDSINCILKWLKISDGYNACFNIFKS